MRLAAAAVVAIALQGAGCLPAGFRVGQPPIDDGGYTKITVAQTECCTK